MTLFSTADPGATDFRPLPGGWSGESFLSRMGGQAHVVRIYDPARRHRADAAEVDAALTRLVRGLVPVPRVVEVRPAKDGAPALLVTEYVEGVRADDVVREASQSGDARTLERVGRALGAVAGALAGVPTLRRGRFTAPDLHALIDRLDKANQRADKKELPRYEFPDCVITAARCGYLTVHGADFRVKRSDACFIRKLDAMKTDGSGIFGGGFLLSENAAAERAQAERTAAENAAAERAKRFANGEAPVNANGAICWELSPRERELQKLLTPKT